MSESADSGEKSTDPRQPNMLPVRAPRFKVNKFLSSSGKPGAAQHFFTPKHMQLLETYAETLDIEQALKKSGMTAAQVRKSVYLMEEIRLINQAAMLKHRSKAALGTHLRLMEKFEGILDDKNRDVKMRVAAMNNLARMSDSNMKAAGEYGDTPENTGITGVQVVINLGAPPESEGPVVDV